MSVVGEPGQGAGAQQLLRVGVAKFLRANSCVFITLAFPSTQENMR